MLILHNGAVLDLPKSFQLDNANNESQDMCGPWAVWELKCAGLPGHGPTGTAQDVDDGAEAEYEKYIGPNTISDQMGSSIDNMHQFLRDAGLHWWDITAISPTSQQASDLAHLYAALDAGYPILVTVNEQTVKRADGSNPYPWQPRLGPVNHIFTLVGHTTINGVACFLADDELNQYDNWPDAYQAAALECHWACIVQVVGPDPAHPWLASIPSGDPTSWPAGYNAQNFAQQGATMLDISAVSNYYRDLGGDVWLCISENTQLGHGMLGFYRTAGQPPYYGLTLFGLSKTNEIPVPGHPGVVIQICERAGLCYDPGHVLDNPPGSGAVYTMHLERIPGLVPDAHVTAVVSALQTLKTQSDAAIAQMLAALGA